MASSHRRARSDHRRRYTAQRIRRIEGATLLAAGVIGLGLLTLLPSGAGDAPSACVICGPHAGADLVRSVALFLPVGAALALIGARSRTTLAVGFGLSVIIELLQLGLPIGRTASIADIVANVAGTAVAFHITRRRRAILYPRSRSALRYATIAAAVWLVVLAVTALLLRPSFPDGQYVAHLHDPARGPAGPAGRVVAASISGIPVPNGPFENSADVRSTLRNAMHIDLRAEFTAASPARLAEILRIAAGADRDVMLVAQRGHDLLFGARVLASELRFVTPTVVNTRALAGVEIARPRVLPIEGRREGGELQLSADGRETTLRLHSGLGWMFLVPPANAILRVPEVGSAIWIGVPLALIGYWTGRRARRKARRAGDSFRLTGTVGEVLAAVPVLGLLVGVGLAGVPLLLGLTVPAPMVWGAAALALGAGMITGILTALSHGERAPGLSSSSSTRTSSASTAAPSSAGGSPDAFRAIP